MDPAAFLPLLASVVSLIVGAIEQLRARKHPPVPTGPSVGLHRRLENWGKENPFLLSIIVGVFFLILSIAIPHLTDGSSASSPETGAGSPTSESRSSGPPSTAPIDKAAPQESVAQPCLPRISSSTDNSIGTADGPLVSGKRYEGKIFSGDEDWLGYCVSEDGPVRITFENACPSSQGPNDIFAYLVNPGEGEAMHYLHPEPGESETRVVETLADTPHFIHVLDLAESDIGSEICSELPWALTVTGALSPVLRPSS